MGYRAAALGDRVAVTLSGMEHLVVKGRSHVVYGTQSWALYFIALLVSGMSNWPQSGWYIAFDESFRQGA